MQIMRFMLCHCISISMATLSLNHATPSKLFSQNQKEQLPVEELLKVSKELFHQNELEYDQNVVDLKPTVIPWRERSGWTDLKFSPNGRYVAIGGMDMYSAKTSEGYDTWKSGGYIEIWDVNTWKQLILSERIEIHIDPTPLPVAFSRDSRSLAAADTYGRVNVWDLSEFPNTPKRTFEFKEKDRNAGIAKSLCFTPNGKQIILALGETPTQQIDVETGQTSEVTPSIPVPVSAIDVSPDGAITIVANAGGILSLDRQSRAVNVLFSAIAHFYNVQFLPSGRHFVAVSHVGGFFENNFVVIGEYPAGQVLSMIALQNTHETGVSLSADGTTLAVKDARVKRTNAYKEWKWRVYGNQSPTIISLWKIDQGKTRFLAQIDASAKNPVRTIGLSPDGKTLVAVGGTIRVWDLTQIQEK